MNKRRMTEGQKEQYEMLLKEMEEPVILKLYLDDGTVSKGLLDCMIELSGLAQMLQIESHGVSKGENFQHIRMEQIPAVYVCDYKGDWKGIAFYGIPKEHELTAFVMGIYNVACPGQEISEDTRRRIRRLKKKLHMKVFVQLSCVVCPELVTAAEKVAALNQKVEVEVYALDFFPELYKKYQIRKVPGLVINEGMTLCGVSNLSELLKVLE